MLAFFFFQAEDGIRDKLVTGVQTCALPIYLPQRPPDRRRGRVSDRRRLGGLRGQGEMLGPDPTRALQHGPADHIAEFADIARPWIPDENLKRLVRYPANRPSKLHAGLGEEELRQVHDIASPFSERRHGDDEFVQPIITVLSEPALVHLVV